MPTTKIKNAEVSIATWKSFQFNLQNFKDLPTTTDHYIRTPIFSCNGHEWCLDIFPGGDEDAEEGHVSIYLNHRSEGIIAINYEVMIIDKFGEGKNSKKELKEPDLFEGMGGYWGFSNFIKRSDILNKSKNILDSDGSLTVGVSIKEKQSDVFVPKNPFQKIVLQGMFLNVDTADVCFEVISSADAKKGKKKKAKASDLLHAHYLILKKCAPMLADLFGLQDNDGKLATATISDIKPDIFRHLLYYVYGGSVPEEELKTHAKDIIDAADKYSIINLKLEAEAAYVKATDITMDNAMDNLLYADAKNCALLKEAVIDFLAENSIEAVEKISFNDAPAYLMKDLLVVIGRDRKKYASGADTTEELTILSVSDLRRKLTEKGLDVDGSREAMIESIKDNATNSDDGNNNDD
jgi:speckle-type POZ protein